MIGKLEALLLCAYLRKLNHPTETDAEISAGVREDLAKIDRQLTEMAILRGEIPAEHAETARAASAQSGERLAKAAL